jgi:hypothetical protein
MDPITTPELTTPEISTTDLALPIDCRFRIWSRAKLEVGDCQVTLEGRHAGLILELLRNRGRRVFAPTLWASMLANGMCNADDSVHQEVAMEIRRIRYTLAAKGILLSVDDSGPEEGFMLSDLCRIVSDLPATPARKRSRTRRSQKAISGPVTERPSFTPGHTPSEVPYSVPERLERRTVFGGGK